MKGEDVPVISDLSPGRWQFPAGYYLARTGVQRAGVRRDDGLVVI
jgi:hypothetical protein